MFYTSNKPKMIVTVAAFAAFLAAFNETFLNVAFSPIMKNLGIGVSTVQWLATGYMLGAAVMVPISAFLYRNVPTKRLFLIAVALLIIGSVIGAISVNFSMLLIGRVIQSIGTGILVPIGMNITLEVAPKDKIGTYMGILGVMSPLGASVSVILAGILLASFSWNVLLWVFAVLSTLCFISGACLLDNIAKLTHPKLDATSISLISISMIGILYGISTAFSGNFFVAVISAVLGAICLYLFVLRQKKLAEPLINLKPLSVKPFAIGVIINLISLIIIFAMNMIIPIFMQSSLGASSLGAALTLVPAIILSCVAAPIGGKVYDKQGAKNILPIGFVLICMFTLALAFCKDTNSFVLLAILYIPVICGSVLIIGPVQSFALSYLEPELNPHGVTVITTGFQIAGCLGSSLFTGVYSATVSIRVASGFFENVAAENGFMVACLLATSFSIIGFALALYARKYGNKILDVK